MMNTIFTISLFTACFAATVSGDCYREYDCVDKVRNKTYEINQTWKPKSNFCYSCFCYQVKRYVLSCKEEVPEKIPTNVRKSSFGGHYASFQEESAEYRVVELTESEGSTKTCEPVRAPTFNYKTWKFETIKYRNVYYYIKQKQSQCCSRFFTYTNISPDCMEVQINKCRTKVVRRSDPSQYCSAPMYMRG